MNQDTGKWNWTRYRELSALMENDVLKDEAKIIDSACNDGDIFIIIIGETRLRKNYNFYTKR